MKPHYWNDAQAHLRKHCPTMETLIQRYQGETMQARGDGFYTLARAVVGQQISVKAADAVWAKLELAVKPLTPQKLLKMSDAPLRICGLSASKVGYLRNVAEFFKQRDVLPSQWESYSDEEVISALTSIKGIGSWTAEMFLIFHLQRPDVFPIKDIGLLKAIDLYYEGTARNDLNSYHRVAQRWAPYRTVATWYLWRALDPVPVAY